MKINTGKAFFHPVTHKLIEHNGIYKGAAHEKSENSNAKPAASEKKTKSK